MTHRRLMSYPILAIVGICMGLMGGNVVLAGDCYESVIQRPAPFMGNNGEIFRLLDGSLWEVMYEYEYMYEYYPCVVVCPDKGKMLISGKSLNVVLLSGPSIPEGPGSKLNTSQDIIESRIEGEFTGWEGETIFKLDNGQIWQQVSYAYYYSYKYRPRVIIFKLGGSYEMQVEGINKRIKVERLK